VGSYDDLIVGSGISGMTTALLLAMNGHKVLLLEKNSHLGGAMARFYKQGIPFDIGFHFTGGFSDNGILRQMLMTLNIDKYIQPVFFPHEKATQLVFEFEQKSYDMPAGIHNLRRKLKGYFPDQHSAIDQYFDMVQKVCNQTVLTDLRKTPLPGNMLDEDFISLDQVLNRLTDNQLLKGVLSAYCLCYGVKPNEVSFANHSRACFNQYESMARVKGGGESFVKAFQKQFAQYGVETMCNRYITDFVDIRDNLVNRFILNTGEEITCDRCILTIHPQEILNALPQKHLSKAFINRVSAFEPSAGFFSLCGILQAGNSKDNFEISSEDNFELSIVSLLPTADLNQILDPDYGGMSSLIILKYLESSNGKTHRILTAFEISFPEHVAAWEDSKPGKRPADYEKYKQKRIDSITERIHKFYPESQNSLEVMNAASILTYRDHLHSPDGAAYGIKQKIGQYNVLGKLHLRNIYAAGQSAVLPGLVGAMMSSFIVCRNIVGNEKYNRFIEQKLCNQKLCN
jgi:all-trans-retinol 13,14-reductase